jgi:hypothetical protein
VESLRRHIEINEEDFFTIEEFMEREDVDGKVVLIEPQILMKLRGIDVVEEFIKRISGYEKIGIGVKIPDGVKGLLKEMKFRKMKVKLKRLRLGLQDHRGKKIKASAGSFAVVSRNPEKFSGITSGQYYSSNLNKFQRASLVNLIKRGILRKFSTIPSTDGLPTFIKGNEVFFVSHPLSLYEMLDAVQPVLDEKEFVLVLSYDEEQPKLEGLDKAYYEIVTRRILKSPRKILKHLQDPGEII